MSGINGFQNTQFTAPVSTEKPLAKEVETPKHSPTVQKVITATKKAVQNLAKSFDQVSKNENCKNHKLGMRFSMKRVSSLAGALFKKIGKKFKETTKPAWNSKVVRKLKDVVTTLEKGEFRFIRKSKKPFIQITFDNEVKKLLNRYFKFEENVPNMTDDAALNEIYALLNTVGEISFSPEMFQIRNAMVAELITKHLVTQRLEEGIRCPIPCFNKNSKPVLINYTLLHRFELGNSGIPVYLFHPPQEHENEGCSPILAFRGTHFSLESISSVRSVVENLNKIGAARDLYDSFKVLLGKFIIDHYSGAAQTAPGFRIMGYSQGALLGQRAVIDFHRYLAKDELNPSLLYNSPGLEADYMDRWDAIPENARPQCINILVTHDIISKRGHKFIGEVFEVDPQKKLSFMEAHCGAKTITSQLEIFRVDNERESKSKTRKLVNEVMASCVVESLYKLINFGLKKIQNPKVEHLHQMASMATQGVIDPEKFTGTRSKRKIHKM